MAAGTDVYRLPNVGSPSLGVLQSRGDVTLREVGSEHGGVGQQLDGMFLEVCSNLNGSVTLFPLTQPACQPLGQVLDGMLVGPPAPPWG